MKKCFSLWNVLALIVVAAGCTKSTPAVPSATTAPAATAAAVTTAATATVVTDTKVGTNGITLTSPTLVSPAVNVTFKFADQPITLTLKNAVTAGSTALTYGVQVALDAGFASIVYTKDGIAENPSGQTSQVIDKLGGAKSYFWRARAVAGGQAGAYTGGRGFAVGPEVVIAAPVLVSPASGSTVFGAPTLTINNASRTGPAGQLSYRFELSDSASFNNPISSTVAEQDGGQTSLSVNASLTTNVTYNWHVQATDPSSGVTSAYSSVFSFKYVSFDLSQARIVDSPFDLASWPITTTIAGLDIQPRGIRIDFSKKDGPDRWPDVPFGSPGDSLQYTLGMALNINGQWYASAPMQYWYGLDYGGGNIGQPGQIPNNWFYDSRWGAMQGYQPSVGETIGFFLCAGICRSVIDGGRSYVKERSNVVLVPMPDAGGATYTFSTQGLIRSSLKRRR
jgi:hypothetical protein